MSKQKYPCIKKYCEVCGKEIIKKKKDTWERYTLKRKYCSVECRKLSVGQPIEKVCKICNKKFTVHNYRKEDADFCSYECYWESKEDKIEKRCIFCNNIFQTVASRNHIYCSEKCRYEDKDFLTKQALKMNLGKFKKNGLNNLELEGNNILTELGFIKNKDFLEQEIMFDKFLVDVVFKDKKIIIEWDGDYWHCNPEIFNENNLDNRQKDRMITDDKRNKFLTDKGYTILRFWENDVYNKKQEVVDEICNYCK